jgi:hypothetical protein
MDNASCHAVRAVVRLGDGEEMATPWYEKGCPQVMDELLLLVRPRTETLSEALKVIWESKIVPDSDDCCRK